MTAALIVQEAYNVWQRAQAMKQADRYEYLAEDVVQTNPSFIRA